MTMPAPTPGNLIHAEGGTGVSHCPDCDWSGVPTFIRGQIQHTCPVCGDKSYEQIEDELNREDARRAAKAEGVGRNDPCPCGSGKKFKKCHG